MSEWRTYPLLSAWSAMRVVMFLVSALFGVASLAWALQQPVGEAISANDDIAKLVKQLGAASFAEREAAEVELRAIGIEALPLLRQASREHEDLEVQARAEKLGSSIFLSMGASPSTGMKLRAIPAGEFLMGSPQEEPGRKQDETAHRVVISRPFLIGATEVTQAEYVQVMRVNPSWFQATGDGREKIPEVDLSQFPIEQVSWFDAIAFCNQLSRNEGEQPYYELHEIELAGHSIRKARVEVRGGAGYRLPTEAEWEYACRAGSVSAFHFGADGGNGRNSNVKGSARQVIYGERIEGASLERTTTVGSYAPNEFGLHDMHGNVAEWCWDWYSQASELVELSKDPVGPESGEQRTVRGGSWLLNEEASRSAARFMQAPGEGNYTTGFRVARSW